MEILQVFPQQKYAAVQGELLNLLPKEQLSQAKKQMKKAKKAVASRWLSFDESVRAMVQEFITHLQVFEFFKENDATACAPPWTTALIVKVKMTNRLWSETQFQMHMFKQLTLTH